MNRILFLLLLAPALAFGAFDANGLKLADNELAVKRVFPGIRCKPLEWKSDAADRRCDDAKVPFGGVEARITVYLKAKIVLEFEDLRELGPVHLSRGSPRCRHRPSTRTRHSQRTSPSFAECGRCRTLSGSLWWASTRRTCSNAAGNRMCL